MKEPGTPVAYSLHLSGEAVELRPGHYWAELHAPEPSFAAGPRPGAMSGEATCRRELEVRADGSVSTLGEIRFADASALTFRAGGRLASAPDSGGRRGAAVGRVTGGRGQLAGASGYIASSFELSDTGALIDHHVGLLFVRQEQPRKETAP